MKWVTLAVPVLLAIPGPRAAAQETPDGGTTDLNAEVAELKRRVEILGQELEAQKTGSAAPLTATGVVSEQNRYLGLPTAASKVYEKDGLSIGGYGETILSIYDSKLQNGSVEPVDNLADTLRAVLYVGYKFNDWLVFNSEFEFEHSGFSDEHPEGEAIVEFAYLDFLITRWLNVRAGQLLLPVGFINEQHEPPTFLGALRPAFEGGAGIIPSTWHEIGVGFYGQLPFNLVYRVFMVNGLDAARFGAEGSGSIGSGRQDGHQAIANKPAFTGRLDWHPLPGTLLGASFYVGNSAQANDSTAVWTTLVEAHAEYRGYGFQARAIYARLTNSADGIRAFGPTSEAFTTGTLQSGGYVEAGYDVLSLVPSTRMALIPFVRYERFNTQQAMAPGAAADPANQRSTVYLGVNYKPIPQVAVKLDYDFNTNGATTGRNQFNVALAYLF